LARWAVTACGLYAPHFAPVARAQLFISVVVVKLRKATLEPLPELAQAGSVLSMR
jgi:hypothetical protein